MHLRCYIKVIDRRKQSVNPDDHLANSYKDSRSGASNQGLNRQQNDAEREGGSKTDSHTERHSAISTIIAEVQLDNKREKELCEAKTHDEQVGLGACTPTPSSKDEGYEAPGVYTLAVDLMVPTADGDESVVTERNRGSLPVVSNLIDDNYQGSPAILQQIKDRISIHTKSPIDQGSVFKFKNQRGSHIPLSFTSLKNYGTSSRQPLHVELCDRHLELKSSVVEDVLTASQATITRKSQIAKNVCKDLDERLSRIECAASTLPSKRQAFLEKEVLQITARVERLQGLIGNLSHSQWEGRIKRNPLW